jgi:deoxyribonuclease IV
MPRLGSHMSIAGGLPLAVERAAVNGCEALQIFSKSSSQWRARALPPEEIATFRERIERASIRPVVAHASYLINLATAEPALRDRSILAFGEEIDRAEALGLMGVVIHPGCFTSGTEDGGIRLVADAVRQALKTRRRGKTLVILEHTAGQGTSLGWRFEQLGRMIEHLDGQPRVAVCLDTCHLWAAGYDLASEAGYRATFESFDQAVGLARLRVFHLNDSRKPFGSRRDRHEHIGKGTIGREPFRRLLNDARFDGLPMILETPKTENRRATSVDVDPLDAANLKTLRTLIAGRRRPRSRIERRGVDGRVRERSR